MNPSDRMRLHIDRARAGHDPSRAEIATQVLNGNLPSRNLDGWRLSPEEERELARAGTPEARERLTHSVLAIAFMAAAKVYRRAPDHLRDDIFGAAVAAIARALDKWNPDGGKDFGAFVYACARNAATDVVRAALRDPAVRLDELPEEAAVIPPVEDAVLDALSAEPEPERPKLRLSALTPRQLEVWTRLHAGSTRAEVARQMGVDRSRVTQLVQAAERRILAAHGVAA